MRKLLILALLLTSKVALAASDAPTISTWIPIESAKTGFSYFGYYSSEVADIKSGNASIYTYHLLALSYQLDSRFTVSLRPTFTYDSAGVRYGYDMPAKTEMADSHIALVDNKPFSLPYDLRTKAVYKLFVPTDPEQQDAGTYGGLGADFEVVRHLPSGFSVGYYPRALAWLQRQNSFTFKEDGAPDKIKPTQIGELEQWLRLTKHFGDKFSVSQGIGLKDKFYNSETQEQERHAAFKLIDTMLNFDVNDNMSATIGVSQACPAWHALKIYNNDETTYLAMISVWM